MIASINFDFPKYNLQRLSMRELAVIMDAVRLARDAVLGVGVQPRCTGKAEEELEALLESLNECVTMIAEIAEAAKPATADEATVRAYIIIHYETIYPDSFAEVVGKAHLLHEDILKFSETGKQADKDPIIAAIDEFKDGCERYNAVREEITHENGETIVQETYGPPHDRLSDWNKPALTREGAIAALKFMDEQKVFIDDVGEGMRKAVLGYLEGMA